MTVHPVPVVQAILAARTDVKKMAFFAPTRNTVEDYQIRSLQVISSTQTKEDGASAGNGGRGEKTDQRFTDKETRPNKIKSMADRQAEVCSESRTNPPRPPLQT